MKLINEGTISSFNGNITLTNLDIDIYKTKGLFIQIIMKSGIKISMKGYNSSIYFKIGKYNAVDFRNFYINAGATVSFSQDIEMAQILLKKGIVFEGSTAKDALSFGKVDFDGASYNFSSTNKSISICNYGVAVNGSSCTFSGSVEYKVWSF